MYFEHGKPHVSCYSRSKKEWKKHIGEKTEKQIKLAHAKSMEVFESLEHSVPQTPGLTLIFLLYILVDLSNIIYSYTILDASKSMLN